MTTATDALQLLKEGNKRFTSGQSLRVAKNSPENRMNLVKGQEPFAIILGCSDSRAPVELVFDQNLGDLFVIRVAGNIATPSGIGSAEFAATQFGTRLIIVLGHSNCGAVKATIGEIQQPSGQLSPNLHSIVDHVIPAVEPLVKSQETLPADELVGKAVQANIHASAKRLRENSPILDDLAKNDGLLIIGAEYSLETGEVTFFNSL